MGLGWLLSDGQSYKISLAWFDSVVPVKVAKEVFAGGMLHLCISNSPKESI